MQLCFYTLNSAAPKGVKNSKLEYGGIIVKLNDSQIKDTKFVTFEVNVGVTYNFKIKLKNILFGINERKSPEINLDLDITIALKNNLSPSRSLISPNYKGASIIFGFGKIENIDSVSFFVSTENITEVKLNNFEVDKFPDINNLQLFIDHEYPDKNPLDISKKIIKIDPMSYTKKNCLYNSKPINGLHEFALLELAALAHDSKYSEMTLEQVVESGVSNLALSNLVYYSNAMPENGLNTELEVSDQNNGIKSKYLLEFSNFLKPLLSNWIDRDLYEVPEPDIDLINYDFCSVYLNSVFDELIDNYLSAVEKIAYHSEFVLEYRLENQIQSVIQVVNSSISYQIFENDLISTVKLEFREICNKFISELFSTTPIPNKENESKVEIEKIYDSLYSECLILFESLINNLELSNLDLVISNVFDVFFKLKIQPIINSFSNYKINSIQFQDNIEDEISKFPNMIFNFYKSDNIQLSLRLIKINAHYRNITSKIFSSINMIIRIRN
jgi:hypothetical protein